MGTSCHYYCVGDGCAEDVLLLRSARVVCVGSAIQQEQKRRRRGGSGCWMNEEREREREREPPLKPPSPHPLSPSAPRSPHNQPPALQSGSRSRRRSCCSPQACPIERPRTRFRPPKPFCEGRLIVEKTGKKREREKETLRAGPEWRRSPCLSTRRWTWRRSRHMRGSWPRLGAARTPEW